MIYRVVCKETGLFIRDDFTFESDTEIGLNVEPSQGFKLPKWNGVEWVEGYVEGMVNTFNIEE